MLIAHIKSFIWIFAQLSQEITFNTNLEKGIYAVIAGAFVCFGGVFLTKGKLFFRYDSNIFANFNPCCHILS